MRYLLLRWLAALVCLSVFSVRQTSAAPKSDQPDDPNFSGAWALDLKASTAFETLMKQIGASLLERKYAASVKLKATIQQTEDVMTIAARGPGFALDLTLYLDGRTAPGKLDLLGATSLKTRTAWSKDHQQLIEAHQIKTKQGKEGQLIIKRYLIDEGKTDSFHLALPSERRRRWWCLISLVKANWVRVQNLGNSLVCAEPGSLFRMLPVFPRVSYSERLIERAVRASWSFDFLLDGSLCFPR